MAYLATDQINASPDTFGAIKAGLTGFREAFATYRRQRAIYLRTLRELQSYRPHELHDLRVQSADFEALARKQAGW